MGQLVSVVQRPSATPGLVRFEANRNLTGMGHERFTSVDQAVGPRPAAALARLLLSTGKLDSVHIFGNMITVNLAKGHDADGLSDVVRDMYQYWKPGMQPPAFDDPAPADAGAAGDGGSAAGESGVTGAAGGADAEFLRLVPAVLVDRSRAAMAKWKASQGA